MPTRTVTGTILHNDGSAWAGGVIRFILKHPFQTSTETYPIDTHEEILDTSGQFSITLGVPDTGTAEYYIIIPDGKKYKVNLEDGAATTLESLLTIAGSVIAQDAVQTLIDANNVLTITDVTSTYVVLDSNEWIRCDGTFTVTLPPATGSGQGFLIMNVGAGIITVDADGSETINGELTQTVIALDSLFVLDAAAGIWDAR
jgi:hypothetical protein